MRIDIIYLYIFFSIHFYNEIYSQSYCENKYDHVWIMGGDDLDTTDDKYGGCEINFNFNPPYLNVHPKSVIMPFQNLSMSSKEGDLMFYSNGCLVFNKLDQEMENGDSLNPGEAYDWQCPFYGYVGFQNMIGLPNSYDSILYYILYISGVFPHDTNAFSPVLSENLYATVVDMSLNNGLGRVISKNDIIFTDTSMIGCPLTATKHANGTDWWIITPDRWLNAFHTVFLGKEGPEYLGKQFIGIPPNPTAEAGQGKFSPDGSRFAWFHPRNGLYLYEFNRRSGLLYNFQYINVAIMDVTTGGCEFSPSGRFVYVNNDYDLYQIDTWSEDVQESVTHIATYDGFGEPLPTSFFYMERTPDNRIIMNVLNGSQYLHVIQEPDRKGTDCRFEQHVLKLPTVNNFTLPHFPNYRLGALEDSLCYDPTVGTIDIQKEPTKAFTIFPNPVNREVNITSNYGDEIYSVSIIDLNGRVIQESKSDRIQLNLPSGMYYLKIVDINGFVHTARLIIQQ